MLLLIRLQKNTYKTIDKKIKKAPNKAHCLHSRMYFFFIGENLLLFTNFSFIIFLSKSLILLKLFTQFFQYCLK